jgi:ABC1 atypical kinase-like domain
MILILAFDRALAGPFMPTTKISSSFTKRRYASTHNNQDLILSLRGGGCCDDVTPADSASGALTEFDEKCNDRAKFVKQILCRRLEYVCSGKRMNDFARWVRKNKGDTSTIVSIRGIEENSPIASALTNRPVPPELESTVLRQLQHDPFSSDRMNLDIVLTSQTPENCFVDKTGMSRELKPPSLFQLGLRAVQLSIHFCPVWSTAGLALVSKNFRENIWYKWVANSIGSSGAAWIKWGQWSSTRNDMFPEALCDQLSTLHAAAPAHAWSYSAAAVEQSLGLGAGSLDCVFDSFDEQPLASGSIAQVHKACLCGLPVAVKIRHPRVQQLMVMDFRLMTAAASLMDKIPALSWLHIRESVEQFSYTIAAQAYLQVEAHHLEVLNYNFRRWPRVKFPTPFYASSSVIIETFEPGKIATDVIDKYDDMAAAVNNGSAEKEIGVTVVEGEDATTNETTLLSNETLISAHDIMPLGLSKFLVSTGVSLYLKMLLIDNLVSRESLLCDMKIEAILTASR